MKMRKFNVYFFYVPSVNKAFNDLRLQVDISLEQGILKTAAWYAKNI